MKLGRKVTLDLKLDSGKFMVISPSGVDFQSKANIIDDIVSEKPASTLRSVSRGTAMPEVRQIFEKKAGETHRRSAVASPNGASISAFRGPIGKATN